MLWLILIILVLLVPQLKEHFQTIETSEINVDDFSAVAPTETSFLKLKPRNKTHIIKKETSKESLQKVNFAIQAFLKEVNSVSKKDWELIEILDFSRRIINDQLAEFKVVVFITNKANVLNLEIIVELDNLGNTNFKKIILFTEKPEISYKGYDPKFSGDFQIKNTLGLLRPFPTSDPRLIKEEDITLNKKEKHTGPFCLDTTYRSKEECLANGSVWDQPVLGGHECPYFRANIHYPNTYGGSKGGFCELPSGMNLKGFRFIDPESKPLCYRCKSGKIDTCCEDQLDSSEYPSLKGHPDYKFPGDTITRKYYKL